MIRKAKKQAVVRPSNENCLFDYITWKKDEAFKINFEDAEQEEKNGLRGTTLAIFQIIGGSRLHWTYIYLLR